MSPKTRDKLPRKLQRELISLLNMNNECDTSSFVPTLYGRSLKITLDAMEYAEDRKGNNIEYYYETVM